MHSTRRTGRNATILLGCVLVLGGAARCSVQPLMPEYDGGAGRGGHAGTIGTAGTMGQGGGGNVDGGPCSDMPIPSLGCAVGRTIPVCTIGADGRGYWVITCPDDPTGTGGTGGAGGRGGAGGSGGASAPICLNSAGCASGEICTTEDGVCNPPPGCTPGNCAAVCTGTCRPGGPACGRTHCATGMVCCNDSCGTCTEPNGGCTQQVCGSPVGGGACTYDGDCHLQADYCTGCDCRALAPGQSVPACTGPGVRCLVDPCSTRTAKCVNGMCAAVAP